MCYCPTPTLHLNLALTGDGAFQLSPQKTYSVWFISILNYGDTENVLINHLLLVIPMSYPCHYTNLCPHTHTHTHIHTHTHSETHKYAHTPHTHTHTHKNGILADKLWDIRWYRSTQFFFYKLWHSFLIVRPMNCSQNFWSMRFCFESDHSDFQFASFVFHWNIMFHISKLNLQVHFCSSFCALKITADIMIYCWLLYDKLLLLFLKLLWITIWLNRDACFLHTDVIFVLCFIAVNKLGNIKSTFLYSWDVLWNA